jgi:hypothetical protein
VDPIALVVIFAVLLAAVALISGPLRHDSREADRVRDDSEREELEAAKEAKYREIRDAELDYQTGKLSESDWRALDRSLRAEAVELLKRLDAVDGS